MSEQERVRQMMQNIHSGNESANKLIFDQRTKTIRPASSYHDPDEAMCVTPSDMEHFG